MFQISPTAPIGRLLSVAILFAGCGGGGSTEESLISGKWRGELLQGTAFCSDGSAISACGGCTIDQVELNVRGGDGLGDPVDAADGTCDYEGRRTVEGFHATVRDASCKSYGDRIRFELVGDGSAAFSYGHQRSIATTDEVTCRISPSGNLVRE